MGKVTDISWLHYYIPRSRLLQEDRSPPERVWLEVEDDRVDDRVKVLGATFNPWIGCAPAVHSAGVAASGCGQCYASALNRRWKWNGTGTWGKGAPRKLASESTWEQARGWARDAARLGLRRRWFFSLGDPLDPEVPEEWRQRLWEFVRETTFLTRCCAVLFPDPQSWQSLLPGGGLDAYLLTKRPWLWELIPEDVRPIIRLGTSASDQQSWDLWVGDLVKAQGFAGLFVSLEPMVAAVDIDPDVCPKCGGPGVGDTQPACPEHDEEVGSRGWLDRIDQVIVGGESGPKARPFRLEWARSVRDQCRAAGVKFFMKQVGSRPYPTPGFDEWPRGLPEHPAGADPSEWPEDLRIQEVP